MQLNAYLIFNGNCEAAFKFYEQTLGGKIEGMVSSLGTPIEQRVPPERRHKILNARPGIRCNRVHAAPGCALTRWTAES